VTVRRARRPWLGAARGHLGFVRDWVRHPERRDELGFEVLRRAGRRLSPRYRLSAYDRAWLDDEEFFTALRRFEGHDLLAESRYALRSLLALVDHVPGDTAECGVFEGCASWFICEHFAGSGRTHHAFDAFEGLPAPTPRDGSSWHAGDLTASEAEVRRLLEPYGAQVHRGWIPEVLSVVEDHRFALVHIDVDLYEPTRASLEFFYERTVPGGLIICDDYGSTLCPGATAAVDEVMAGHPEPVIHLPSSQGVIQRR
jgi:hypothetical protein